MKIHRPLFCLILAISFVPVAESCSSRALRSAPIAQSATNGSFLHPCHVPDIDDEVRCGKYEVYEDRVAKKGRRIALNIVVVPALSATAAP